MNEIDQIAENLIRNEILCCDSALVDMLLERGIVSIEDVANLSRDVGELDWYVWNVGWNMPGFMPECDPMPCDSMASARGWLVEILERHAESDDDMADEYAAAIKAIDTDTTDQDIAIRVGNWEYWITRYVMSTDDLRSAIDASSRWWDPFDDGWRCIEGIESEDDLIQEPLEWWRVTTTLARDLVAIGQPVLKSDYGTWWGRTCTGQAIIADGTMQTVAQLINDRIGGVK